MASILLTFPLLIFSFTLKAKDCNLSTLRSTFKPKYARHFFIEYYDDFKIVHVDEDAYFLSSSRTNCSGSFQAKIHLPVSEVAFMSTTYLPALELLGKTSTLKAFQGKQYIVSNAFNKKALKDLPYKFNPENLLSLNLNLIMGHTSNLSERNQKTIFSKLGLPVVINKDFEETNPLARAEWLIFTSSFYNLEEKAKSIFNEIENNYHELKKENEKLTVVSVLVGDIESGFWVTCGGLSDLAHLIKDARGQLAYANNSKETQRISLEELLKEKKQYSVWLTHNKLRSVKERVQMVNKDQRYKYISAERIYNNNLISNENGATDFWEMALQRPDWLLKDLSAILHPEKFPGYKLKWYRKI